MPDTIEIESAALRILQSWDRRPRIGIILGSGLGELVDHIQVEADLPYSDIPHFAKTTVVGHCGRLMCGRVLDEHVIVMQGRFHLYEGFSVQQVGFPIRVMRSLGVDLLIISNACGGLHPHFCVGDVVVIEDQINFMFRNPSTPSVSAALHQRHPVARPMYDLDMLAAGLAAARKLGLAAQRGIYAGVLGPNYETRAEMRMLRRLGADVVGMSTIVEVGVAVQLGMRVVGLSIVTNVCRPDAPTQTTGEAVIATARSARHKIRDVICGLIQHMATARITNSATGA
jgi:purine-nucleoside phosphorylase